VAAGFVAAWGVALIPEEVIVLLRMRSGSVPDESPLAGSVAVVTGATRGIGRQTAPALGAAGT